MMSLFRVARGRVPAFPGGFTFHMADEQIEALADGRALFHPLDGFVMHNHGPAGIHLHEFRPRRLGPPVSVTRCAGPADHVRSRP